MINYTSYYLNMCFSFRHVVRTDRTKRQRRRYHCGKCTDCFEETDKLPKQQFRPRSKNNNILRKKKSRVKTRRDKLFISTYLYNCIIKIFLLVFKLQIPQDYLDLVQQTDAAGSTVQQPQFGQQTGPQQFTVSG